MSASPSIYNKTNMFHAAVTERYSLCKGASEKNVAHVILSLKGSGLTYQVGDSLAIAASHDPELVQATLKALGASGEEIVKDKQGENFYTLKDFFTKKASLGNVTKKLIATLAERQTIPEKKERLSFLLEEGQKDALKAYQAAHEIWDTLAENSEVKLEPQELCNMMMPLLPRFYSIASSHQAVGDEVHLTVAELTYETNGHIRHGVATHYLCQIAKLNEASVPVYVHPSNGFTLPEDNSAPLIMIGPGTGIAPYRGFMQERILRGATGGHWLFFGEWHHDQQFYYEEYWKQLIAEGHLRLDTAFSRDQEHKIYVQHRMHEKGAELFKWLQEGAYLYVCGDAHRMAKDVDAMLHQIIRDFGGHDEQGAKEYVKALKASKRYLRDVY